MDLTQSVHAPLSCSATLPLCLPRCSAPFLHLVTPSLTLCDTQWECMPPPSNNHVKDGLVFTTHPTSSLQELIQAAINIDN
ncbi:hypothetical protein EV368DRAFT_90399 [Lentinula lateritia]|nr:hypothetical protein EV368DRAFT_90399 [Lentinula lateritia]